MFRDLIPLQPIRHRIRGCQTSHSATRPRRTDRVAAMDLQDRKRMFDACQPDRPLEPHDPRYVEIDRNDRPRRYDWVEHIAGEFLLPSDPTMLLLTGLPGTGKTTELLRVAEVLSAPEGAHLLPIWIDAAKLISLHDPLEFHELVFVILAETERHIATVLEGERAPKLAHEGLVERLWTSLQSEVALPNFEFGSFGSKMVLELRSNPTFKRRIKDAISTREPEFVEQAYQAMQSLRERARRVTTHKDLILIVDSLEQLRGIRDETTLLDSVERVFGTQLRPQTLGVHAIFTVPPALATRRMLEIRFMPLIKIREKDGSRFDPGHRAMWEMVMLRMTTTDLEQVFGGGWSARIDCLIDRSGGYARELIRMLQDSIKLSSLPLDNHDFEIVMGERADRYRRLVPGTAIPLLAKIHREHPPLLIPDVNPESTRLMELLLTNNLVMVYQNKEEWIDINPAITSLVEARRD